jgi:putative endonuclease
MYNVTKLVYFEPFGDVRDAIAREKQLKRWRREKKVVSGLPFATLLSLI